MKLRDLLKLNEDIDAEKLKNLVGKKVKKTKFKGGTIIISFDDNSYLLFTNNSNAIIGKY